MGLFSRKKGGVQPAIGETLMGASEPVKGTQDMLPPPRGTDATYAASAPAASPASARTLGAFPIYGKIMRLLSLSPDFRTVSLGEIDALVSPAIAAGQVIIAETQPKDDEEARPAAFALWASVSAEVDARLSANLNEQWLLGEAEWRSGDIPWLILAVGDNRVLSEMLRKFCEVRFSGRPLKMRMRGREGKNILASFPPPRAQ